MGAHIDKDGQFQSDKYPTCPPGKVPLSVKDRSAQDLLWEYAERHRQVDEEFSKDLETALRSAGFQPTLFFLRLEAVRGALREAIELHAERCGAEVRAVGSLPDEIVGDAFIDALARRGYVIRDEGKRK